MYDSVRLATAFSAEWFAAIIKEHREMLPQLYPQEKHNGKELLPESYRECNDNETTWENYRGE